MNKLLLSIVLMFSMNVGATTVVGSQRVDGVDYRYIGFNLYSPKAIKSEQVDLMNIELPKLEDIMKSQQVNAVAHKNRIMDIGFKCPDVNEEGQCVSSLPEISSASKNNIVFLNAHQTVERIENSLLIHPNLKYFSTNYLAAKIIVEADRVSIDKSSGIKIDNKSPKLIHFPIMLLIIIALYFIADTFFKIFFYSFTAIVKLITGSGGDRSSQINSSSSNSSSSNNNSTSSNNNSYDHSNHSSFDDSSSSSSSCSSSSSSGGSSCDGGSSD